MLMLHIHKPSEIRVPEELRFCAYLAELYEQHALLTLEDLDLVLSSASVGILMNPITEERALTNSSLMIHRGGLADLLSETLDPKLVTSTLTPVVKRLHENHRIRTIVRAETKQLNPDEFDREREESMWHGVTPLASTSKYKPIVAETGKTVTVIALNAGPGTVQLESWAEKGAFNEEPAICLEMRPGDQRAIDGVLVRARLKSGHSAAVAWRILSTSAE